MRTRGGTGSGPSLGRLFWLLTFVWIALYGVAIDRARAVFSRARVYGGRSTRWPARY